MFPGKQVSWRWWPLLAGLAALAGCGGDMADQPRFDPLEGSSMFANGMASRPLIAGTVARGHLETDLGYFQGRVDGRDVAEFPLADVASRLSLEGDEQQLRRQILERGQQRFQIFCAPCHGLTGDGHGMVVARGFPAPPSFHIPRLRAAPVGHVFEVITDGFGRMYDYRDQIPPTDRWAIVAYVRALQLSQHVPATALPEIDRRQLESH